MAFPTTGSATSTNFTTSVTSMPVNLPATPASGDLLVAFACVRNAGTWTLPSGWNEYDSQSSGGVGELTLFAKVSDGTEGVSDTWTAGTGTTATWHAFLIPAASWFGTIPATLADWVAKSTNAGGAGSATNPPALTPAWGAADTLWITVAQLSAEAITYSAAPTNYVEFIGTSASSGGSTVSMGSGTRELNAASDDPGNFTSSGNARWWDAMTIAVRPAAGGAPATRRYSLGTLGVG